MFYRWRMRKLLLALSIVTLAACTPADAAEPGPYWDNAFRSDCSDKSIELMQSLDLELYGQFVSPDGMTKFYIPRATIKPDTYFVGEIYDMALYHEPSNGAHVSSLTCAPDGTKEYTP